MSQNIELTDRRQATRDGFQLTTAQVIRALLDRRKLDDGGTSVGWLSDTTGIPSATLTRLLAGTTPASLANLASIAAAFGMSLAALVAMIEETVQHTQQISAQQLDQPTVDRVKEVVGAGDDTASDASWLGVALSSPVTKGIIGGAAGIAAGLALRKWWKSR